MNEAENELIAFLKDHRAPRDSKNPKKGKKGAATHTSMGDQHGNNKGSYTIPPEDMKQFLKIYTKAIQAGSRIGINETHTGITTSPIVVDLDLALDLPRDLDDAEMTHIYSPAQLHDIVQSISTTIKKYVDTSKTKVKAFVFTRQQPYVHVKKGKIKDGIHIIYPFVCTTQETQDFLRSKLLEDAKLQRIFYKKIKVADEMSVIIDRSVISQNWLLYGASKYDDSDKTIRDPYELVHVYKSNMDDIPLDQYAETDLVSLLSIRNKDNPKRCVGIKKEYAADITAYFASPGAKKKTTDKTSSRATSCAASTNSNYDQLLKEQVETLASQQHQISSIDRKKYNTITHIVRNLSPSRAEPYGKWVEVGMALKNIDETYLDLWIEFSKKAPNKFAGEEDCKNKWDRFICSRRDGYGYGSLLMWLEEDNPEEYKVVSGNHIWRLIDKSLLGNGPSHSVAEVLYAMNPDSYVCVCPKKKEWYYYEGHYWHRDPVGSKIRDKITKELYIEYKAYGQYLTSKVSNGAGTNDSGVIDFSACMKKQGIIDKIIPKLQTGGFINDVMNELGFIYYEKNGGIKFLERLDTNPDLLAFENGVINLQTMEFRHGTPEDMCSLSTDYEFEYLPYDHKYRCQVRQFMEQILTKEDVREYVYQLIAYSLDGHCSEEIFPIFSGKDASGGNGKSKLVENLWAGILGNYATTISVAHFTQKRPRGESANPEMYAIKGKRLVYMSEPEHGLSLNVDYMKNLTGGESITVRTLFSEPVKFKPMCLFLMMCNLMPEIKRSDDGGAWRRLRNIIFKSIFKDDPDPNNPYEFQKDPDLPKKMKHWTVAFMNEILDHRRKLILERKGKFYEPERVKKYTSQYRKASDHFIDFIDETIVDKEGTKLALKDVTARFREWFKENYPGDKVPNKTELKGYLSKKYGKPHDKNSATCYWPGHTFITSEAVCDFDED